MAVRSDGRVAPLVKVDVLNGLVRLDQHAAQFKLNRFQKPLKRCKVLWREPREQLIAK